MYNAVEKLASYLPNLFMNFGRRSFEAGYIMGLMDSRVLTGKQLSEDHFLSSGNPRNAYGLHQFIKVFLGEESPGTKFLQGWIDTNPDRQWELLKADELALVYALVHIDKGEPQAEQAFLNLMQ